MIDAAKLDEIEHIVSVRENLCWAMAQPEHPGADWMNVAKEADAGMLRVIATFARPLLATARQAIALRALIDAHNAGCEADCKTRREKLTPGLCVMYRATSKGRCPDCPRLDMIDVPAGDAAQPKEPGAC